MNTELWTPSSWQQKTCSQKIDYPDKPLLNEVVEELAVLPPLVTPFEVDNLKSQLAEAAEGKTFLLQGGDCAENFNNCRPELILNKLKILLQMSLVLIHGLRKPVIRVGRIAGQYAKPRSVEMETKDGVTLPCYRGDIINKAGFSPAERIPNPLLMREGFSYSSLTLNYIRSLVDGGFADLQHPEYWNLDFVKHSPLADEYQNLVDSIGDALSFMRTIAGLQISSINRVEFYTSHEALNLYYEQALTRQQQDGRWYNLSCHYPWVGMRTLNLDGAHLEFLRGLSNPVAIKVGASMSPDTLQKIVDILNPENEPGRLTLIVRLGANQVKEGLPKLIKAVQATHKNVLWSSDPMHGNTQTTQQGFKTRRFEDILTELQESFRIHHAMGTYLGGVHFELTGEDVTECLGGARGLKEEDLNRAYESLVDPRLNYEQALEMAMLIVKNTKG